MDTNLRKKYERDMHSNKHWGRIEAKRMNSKIKEAKANGDKEISIRLDSAESILLLLMYFCDSKSFDDVYRDYLNGINERVDEMLKDVRETCGIIK